MLLLINADVKTINEEFFWRFENDLEMLTFLIKRNLASKSKEEQATFLHQVRLVERMVLEQLEISFE